MSSKNDDFFGGLFDFNGDGKTSIDEEFLAYKIFEETTKEENGNDEIEDTSIPSYYTEPRAASVIMPEPVPQSKMSGSDTLSKENYPQRMKTQKSGILAAIIAGLFFSFVPVLIMWATIASYDGKNNAYWFVFLLFFGGGLVVLGFIWNVAIKSIIQDCTNLRIMKANYQKLLSEDELSAIHKKKHKGWIITSCIFGVIITVIISMSAINSSKLSDTYNKAVALVDNGSYKEAVEMFEEIADKDYHDTGAYISLCKAHLDYDRGYISSAYYDMNKVRFSCLSSEQEKTVNDFVATLKDEYDVYLKEKAEAEAKAYRDRITYGVPYVGMPESEIKNTSLGAPSSDVRHNYECISGEQYLANLYDFKSGNKTIFTARCVQGRVTEVWDHRSDPIIPYIPKKSTKTDNDPYDVNDYYNEEDFYYDHYDDFFDYYDAEDYYNEHHK